MKRLDVRVWGIVLTLSLLAFLVAGVAPAAAQTTQGRIAGVVFSDKNDNGVREEEEVGVPNTRLRVVSTGYDATVTTAADGSFSLDVDPANYTVTITDVPTGYFTPEGEDASTAVTIGSAGFVSNLEFRLVPESDVLPASGGVVPGGVLLAGLAVLVVAGAAMVVIGQRRAG